MVPFVLQSCTISVDFSKSLVSETSLEAECVSSFLVEINAFGKGISRSSFRLRASFRTRNECGKYP